MSNNLYVYKNIYNFNTIQNKRHMHRNDCSSDCSMILVPTDANISFETRIIIIIII